MVGWKLPGHLVSGEVLISGGIENQKFMLFIVNVKKRI